MLSNTNLLNNLARNRAVATIPDMKNVSFTLVNFMLPGMALPAARQPMPFTDKPQPGEKIMFDPLTFEFIVTENLENWLEIQRWMYSLGAPISKNQYKDRPFTFQDISVTIYSSHNNPILRVKLIGCVPTSLDSVLLTTSENEPAAIVSSFTVEYDYFEVEPV
jgi:hypothetical protein